MSNPIRSRIPAFAVAFTLASMGAACSSSSGTADTTAPSTAASPTTEAVATTTTATTDAATSSTTVEDAIRAAHTRVMTEVFKRDERIDGPEAMLPLAEELTTGPLLRRISDGVAERSTSGERAFSPGFDSHIVKVTILSATHAQVVDCSQDRGERYSADGALLVGADDFYKLRTSDMVLENGRWVASDVFAGGDERCEPNE